MLSTFVIEQIVDSQKERLAGMNPGLVREFKEYSGLTSHAFIVSGIRRCGKSTLLQQMHRSVDQPSIFLNFEDPRLAGFDLSDLNRLQEIAE